MRIGGEPAFLAIADVSGYTSYLAGVELDHATDILADLVGTVVDAMVPFDAPVPVPVTWEYVTSPTRRPMWTTGISEIIEMSPDGRRGVGTTNHCMHGTDVVIERIIDWQPPTYWLVRSSLPEAMGGVDILMSDELTELPDAGTRVTLRVGRPTDVDPATFAAVAAGLDGLLSSLGDRLNAILADVAAELALDAEREPEIPASRARFLTEPVIGSTEEVARPSA